MDFDPERGLWIPGRRRFFILGGLALAGTMIARTPRDWRVEVEVRYVTADGRERWEQVPVEATKHAWNATFTNHHDGPVVVGSWTLRNA